MQIKLHYFGQIQEIAGTAEEFIDIESSTNTETLSKLLEKKYANLNAIDYRIAVNQAIINENTFVSEDDEIALMPPFSGG